MKRKRIKRALALLLGFILAFAPCAAGKELPFRMVSQAQTRAATINATSLNVRSGPGTGHQAIAKLSQGASVSVVGETTGTDGKLWYQIRFSGSGGTQVTGYVLGQYVKFPTTITSSADFEKYLTSQGFPESYKPGLRELHAKYPTWTFTAFHTGLDWETAVQNESVIGRNLVGTENISSWKSTAPGAYDWDTGTWPGFDGNSWVQASEDIIRYYMDPRNFLNDKYIYQFMDQTYNSAIHTREGLESMVKGTFLSGTVTGGGSSISYSNSSSGSATGPGMLPTASISDHKIPRVMTSFGPGMSGGGGVPSETSSGTVIVPPGTAGGGSAVSVPAPGTSNTTSGSSSGSGSPSAGPGGGSSPGGSSSGSSFVSGTVSFGGSGVTSYVDILMNAAVQSGVSPYILASMILQEQGSQGTGNSISGRVSGYQGYYNFFNIEAYQSGSMSAVQRGLWWASQSGSYMRPWNSVERSIIGGAIYYGTNYVSKGQDTLYLKKFNVQGDNLYKHQYMTNVLAAAAEGMALAKIDALKSMSIEFSIPVYKNMPATACVKPTLDGSPNNKLSGLGVEGFYLTPTFHRDTESYDLIVDPSVTSVKVVAAAIDSKTQISGTGTIDLQSGINQVTIAVRAQNGHIRNYKVNIVRQSNGPVYSESIGTNVLVNSSSGGPGGGTSVSSGSTQGPGAGPGISGSGTGSSGSGNSSSGTVAAPGGNNSGSAAAPGSGSSSGTSNSTNSGSSSGSQMPGSGGTVISGSSNVVVVSPMGGSSSSGGSGSPGGSSSGTAAPGGSSSGSPVMPGTVSGGTGSGPSGPSGTTTSPGNSSGTAAGGGSSAVQAGKGDTNGDGKINIMDVLNIQRHILGVEALSESAAAAADVNGNNKVDIMDVLMLQKQILGG